MPPSPIPTPRQYPPAPSAFEYNADGLLNREIIEPGNLEHNLQTDTEYDSYGNKIQVTTTSPDAAPAVTIDDPDDPDVHTVTTQYSGDGRFLILSPTLSNKVRPVATISYWV